MSDFGEAIEEIRAVRVLISARFGHDLHRLADHLRSIQSEFPNPVIIRPHAPGGTDSKSGG